MHNNPDRQALERWRRDTAAREWYMEAVITGIPILTQIALATFLIGFVFRSLVDDHAIGIEVAVLVGLGALAYALVTLLPLLRPDCPYQTPITEFLYFFRLVRHLFHLVRAIFPNKDPPDTDTKKFLILKSRLNPSSNDEIFSAAASMLDDKLESSASLKWYKGVLEKAPELVEALFVRLTSFTHQVQKIKEPSASNDAGNCL